MSKFERISRLCLYMGALLLVLYMDWCWYAKHYHSGKTLMKLEIFSVIYAAFDVAIICSMGLAAYFNWKSTPRQIRHKDKRNEFDNRRC